LARFSLSHRPARTLSAALLSTLVLAGCATPGSSPDPASAGNAPVPQAFEHVHGLGADPLTGNTYAATHQGVWLIPTEHLPDSYLDGTPRSSTAVPTQIAGRAQDTMAFTVAVPGHLLASGHPAPGEQTDLHLPNLGLISSTDGAMSWSALSLDGETDFHDLAAVRLDDTLRVYGYDAGAGSILVSDDSGTTWSTGATLPLRDLTVDPSQPDRVFATTAEGLALSEDAARTFTLVAGAPVLLLVEAVGASAGGGVVGIDGEGTLWRQEASADTWTQMGTTTGPPDAFTVVGGSSPWILVSVGGGIAASDDYGRTWTELL